MDAMLIQVRKLKLNKKFALVTRYGALPQFITISHAYYFLTESQWRICIMFLPQSFFYDYE